MLQLSVQTLCIQVHEKLFEHKGHTIDTTSSPALKVSACQLQIIFSQIYFGGYSKITCQTSALFTVRRVDIASEQLLLEVN